MELLITDAIVVLFSLHVLLYAWLVHLIISTGLNLAQFHFHNVYTNCKLLHCHCVTGFWASILFTLAEIICLSSLFYRAMVWINVYITVKIVCIIIMVRWIIGGEEVRLSVVIARFQYISQDVDFCCISYQQTNIIF